MYSVHFLTQAGSPRPARAAMMLCMGAVLLLALLGSAPATAQSGDSPWVQWLQEAETSAHAHTERPRCLTSAVIEHERMERTGDAGFRSLFYDTSAYEGENSYQSPGGGFLVWYDLDGEHAIPPEDSSGSGIPDWVEMIAAAADSSRYFYTDSLGFADPVQHRATYNIYLRNLGVYGFTSLQDGVPFSVIDSSFDWAPGNDAEDEPAGAARATVAHELYHAIQYSYNQWQGPTGSTAWLEMDALAAEHQVFPDVREYLNFIGANSIFRIPAQSTPVAYEHATWLMYFNEAIAPDMMRHVWQRVAQQPGIYMEQALREELLARGLDYDQHIVNLHLWHIASGGWSRPGFGFADAERYPTSFKRSQRNTLPSEPYTFSALAANAANYYALIPQPGLSGNTLAALFNNAPETGWALIAYYPDGSVETIIPGAEPGHSPQLFASDWQWDEIEQLGIVIVNSHADRSQLHQLLLGNQESIEQIRYGDIDDNGIIREEDALWVLQDVSGAAESSLPFAARYAGDVSGNGTLTGWDAGLIFRRSSGFPMPFPADINQSGFGPDLPRFELNEPEGTSGTKVFLHDDGRSAPLETLPQIQVELQAESLYRGEEAKVDVVVSGLPQLALSVELTLYFPPAILEFQEVLSGFSNFGEIIQSHGTDEAGKMKVVWASNQYATNGVLGTLVFQMLDDGSPEVVLTRALINEIEADYELLSVSFDAEPGDPVSLPPGEDLEDDELPFTTQLKPAYPNPFNPQTNIPFTLSGTSDVRIVIYDTMGRRVITLADGSQWPAGEHSLRWDATGYASGVYWVVMEAKAAGSSGASTRETRAVSLVR